MGQDFIRGTRSRAPYGYSREGSPNKGPEANLLVWILVILFLSAMAIFSWMFPAYVFRNPQVPFNYDILRRMGKLEDLKTFTATRPPQPDRIRGKFFTARQIFDKMSGRPDDQLEVINDIEKRLYVQNYEEGEMLGFVTGEFEIVQSRRLGEDDFFPGLALEAKSKEFPNVILEYLFPIEGDFENPYEVGQTLRIDKGGELAVILHIAHLTQDRLSVSALSLTYFPNSRELNVKAPSRVNLRADWPVFTEEASAAP